MNNGDRKFSWRYAAELIAVASVVFSLIFVGLELRLSRAAAEIERTTTISALSANIRSQISMNSETWYRGCIGEDLSPEDQIVFTNTVLAYINLIFTIFTLTWFMSTFY